LFALTFVAPWAWRRNRAERPKLEKPRREVAAKGTSRSAAPTEAAAKTASMPELPPALPPLAAGAGEARLTGPMVQSDDYVAVDEPLVQMPPAEATVAHGPELMSSAAMPAAMSSAAAEGPELQPRTKSVLVRDAPAPKATLPPAFTAESLAKVRGALMSVVEKAREAHAKIASMPPAQPTILAPVLASPLRVMVQSEADRLAMIPPKEMPLPEVAAAPEPAAQAEVTPSPAEQAPVEATDQTADAATQEPAVAEGAVLRHRPEALVAQLEALKSGPGSEWAEQVLAPLGELTSDAIATDRDWQPTIAELRLLAEHGFNDALKAPDAATQSAWLRASRALDRRLPVWGLLVDRDFQAQLQSSVLATDNGGLMQAVDDILALTAGAAEGAAWRQYLRLDDLAGMTSVAANDYSEQRRAVARDVLLRMSSPWLTPEQRDFVGQPPVVALAEALRPWASGEVSLDTLAAFIERYESTSSLRDADAIAELRLRMKWSDEPRLQALAEDLNRNYRNANMRVAFAAELMNRMIPPQQPVAAPVHSNIAGADVRGQSLTETEIHVKLLPDPTVWRFGLEVNGQVNSHTVSQTWPAQVKNCCRVEYEARKLVLVNRYGVHVYPAEAHADGDTNLLGVDSSFTPVPIIGALIVNAAREQNQQSRPQAIRQVNAKVEREACERMNNEANAKLARLDERFHEKVMEPMERFGLSFEPIDLNTTAERATMRLRLGGEQQLGAHTPRPSAPSDSLASVQLHESAFNNALMGLGLDGKRLTAVELHTLLADKLQRPAAPEPEDLPRGAKVQFAEHDAVRLVCREDRVELILKIVELRHGRDSIRGVGVHAFFRPVVDGLDIKLVRDGSIQFDGAHLRAGPRVVLHSVFGKLLPKDQELPILAAKLSDDPRFKGLMVTQLVIDDGWVAMSIGPALPNRVAWRTRDAEVR
jgi:hypothetical protein